MLAVVFTKEEIAIMAEPFKLSLVGKFSFGRPTMDLIRKFFSSLGLKGESHVSLLDKRHILIKLRLEEDYTRLWTRQSWFVHGHNMRVFKWTPNFWCNEESPVVPVWITLPYLPVHLVQCKTALFSIASAIGKPLRVDHATATLNRPTVARVLVECDVTQPSFVKKVWVGEEDGFVQDIIIEKLPDYCMSCKHLGHKEDKCFVANPTLRPKDKGAPPVVNETVKGKSTMKDVTGPKERLVYVAKNQKKPILVESAPTTISVPEVPSSIISSHTPAGPSSVTQASLVPSSIVGTSTGQVQNISDTIIIDSPVQVNAPVTSVPLVSSVVAPVNDHFVSLDSTAVTITQGSGSGTISPPISLLPDNGPGVTFNCQSEEVPSNHTLPSDRAGSSCSDEDNSSEDDTGCGLDDRYASDPGASVDDSQSQTLPSQTDTSTSHSGTGSKEDDGYQMVLRSRGGKKGASKIGTGSGKPTQTLSRKGPGKSK